MSTVSLQPSAPTPDVTRVLDDVFSLCRIPFVHDFVFTTDPVADISMLTAPVQNEHAIAARVTVAGREDPPAFAHVFDFTCDFHFCSIPAFSVESITVGFATQEPAESPTHAGMHQPPGVQRVQCNRFVRDDATGVFLMVAENPVTAITEIDYISHASTRRRTRVCARFHTDILRRILRTDRSVLQPADLTAALSYLSITYERRACPICRIADSGDCTCVLPFRRPAHPLDFRNEQCNMRLHTGLYEGGSTVRLFNAAIPFIVSSLATETIIKGSLDKRVVTRLNKYAVQDRMSKLRMNPFPGVSFLGGVTDAGEATKDVGGAGAAQEETVEATGGSGVALPDESFLQDSHRGDLKSPWIGTFGIADVLSGDTSALMMPHSAENGTAMSEVAGMASPPLAVASVSAEASRQVSAAAATAAAATAAGTAAALATAAIAAATDKSCAESAVADAGGPRSGAIEAEHTGGGSSEGGEESATPSDASRMRSADTVEAGGADWKQERQLKLELRKRRNRAAAAKSNIKRKVRNEQLRRDLREVNEKAERLRATERELREENVKLRGLATQRNFQVSRHLTHIQITSSRS